MTFKKIISVIAAAAISVSALAFSASAATTSTFSDKNYTADGTLTLIGGDNGGYVAALGWDASAIYGVKFTVTVDADTYNDPSSWFGGGIGWNSTTNGWVSNEWGKHGKDINLSGVESVLTLKSDKPIFKASEEYAAAWIQAWSGDIVVTNVEILDKDGKVLAANPNPVVKESAETEAPKAEEKVETKAPKNEEKAETKAPKKEEKAETTKKSTTKKADKADKVEKADVVEEVVVDIVAADEVAVPEVADVAPVVVAPAADSTTTPAKTGNTASTVILSVIAVAGAAALVSKKRK